jgi:hypothetical protein
MQDSHTHASADDTAGDPSPLRLVSASTAGLPQWLAGRVDEHLATFAAHMTQGLLAASTAVGLEVMAELMDVEVAELVGPKGKHDPARVAMRHGSEQGTLTLGGRRLGVRRPGSAAPAPTPTRSRWSPTPRSPPPTCSPRASWPGCWPGCRRGATRPGSSRSASRSTPRRVGSASRRSRAGSWLRPPSGWPSCWPGGWTTGASWWCSWTALGWASTCWSARWA